ncbi:RNA polymerase sigma factor sigF, chloroplastic [Andrographis paniculata]|uniref:RNA polymerase sigma factor sigF, chloroplastic n=1 Tax=Andrographis paniculata TaxID=175694 RepID=UPI0021E978B9|nr:RNA polymerase sigma factor sigF, chloroplastic [Andrographis paniculata]
MEFGRSLVSSPTQLSFRATHFRNCSASSNSVLLLHEQVTPVVTSLSTISFAGCSPTSVLAQEQRNDSRQLLCLKDDTTSQLKQASQVVVAPNHSTDERDDNVDPDLNDFRLQLLRRPELWYLWLSFQRKEQYFPNETKFNQTLDTVDTEHVIALAKEAFAASKEAATIAKDAKLFESGLTWANMQRTVRSTRLLERQAKRRRVPKHNVEVQETHHSRKVEQLRKSSEEFDPNDPLRLFLSGPETTQLLTAKEESELIAKIQDLKKLQEVRMQLQSQFSREPTLLEWSAAVGLSCQALQSELRSGNRSREKLIYANFRLVVHIAKQYQGRGLNLQDLMQEGSMGLMRSVEKFKPQAGCRFATYAYWWIRQSIRKSLFLHSRTIRLPENVYALLSKVYEAKKLCFQQGNHNPTKEDIARNAGISVVRLEELLYTSRTPQSIQQPVWTDQDTTLQEITADTAIESPDVCIAKQLMRKHVRGLLNVLSPRERKIIRLRFGIEDGKQRSLSEIGDCFGLSKERVRQLESRAMYRLKQCLNSHGLAAYAEMIV